MGDADLFIPTGNVVGIFWAIVATFVARTGWRTRALALGLAGVAVALPHLGPDAWLATWPSEWPRAAFLVGFAPPLGVAALVLFVARRRAAARPGTGP